MVLTRSVSRSCSCTRVAVPVHRVGKHLGAADKIDEDVPVMVRVGGDVHQPVPALPNATRRNAKVRHSAANEAGRAERWLSNLIEQPDLVDRLIDRLGPHGSRSLEGRDDQEGGPGASLVTELLTGHRDRWAVRGSRTEACARSLQMR